MLLHFALFNPWKIWSLREISIGSVLGSPDVQNRVVQNHLQELKSDQKFYSNMP